VNPAHIAEFLISQRIIFREHGNNFAIRFCPFCEKPHNNDYTNMNTLNINGTNGLYHCFRCGTKGNWYSFKNNIMLKLYGKSLDELVGGASFNADGLQTPQINAKYDVKLAHNAYLQLEKDIYPDINRYLTTLEEPEFRGIRKETLLAFKVGVGKEKFRNDQEQLSWFDSVWFPLYAPKSKKQIAKEEDARRQGKVEELETSTMNTKDLELVKMKIRAIGKDNKHR